MKHRRFAHYLLAAAGTALCLAEMAFLARAQDQSPATRPTNATTQPMEAQITPAAQKVLDQLQEAYAKVQSVELAGTVSVNTEIGDKKESQQSSFTALFQAPNKFRHEVPGHMLLGSTGQKVYIYSVENNHYAMDQAPSGRTTPEQLTQDVGDVLQSQNPSLLLAVCEDAAKQLGEGATRIDRNADTGLDGKTFVILTIAGPQGPMQLFIDPQTHLLRRMSVDLSSMLERRGVPNVKTALLQFDYTHTLVDPPVSGERLAWTPPAGAKDVSQVSLVGKAAPAFSLKGLDGKSVALADLKGNVVVLDFWATWCGPCRAALPGLDAIYQRMGPTGVKVYAINLREDKDTVQGFVNSSKLTIPVLLSADDVDQKYQVEGIPHTVVIGKDGTVRRIFVGLTSEKQIQAAIDQATKG